MFPYPPKLRRRSGKPLRFAAASLAWAFIILGCHSAYAQSQADPEASVGPLRKVPELAVPHAMVVSANPHATAAGMEILRAGGNAIDAAAAVALALNVVEPQSSGAGGGAFALVALQGKEPVTAWDGREEAPAAVIPEWFLRPDGKPQPFFPDRITGGRPVGVPGLVKLLDALLSRYGKLGWPAVVRPAVRLAEEGFPVSPRLARALAAHATRLVQFPATRDQFFHSDGSPISEGETLRQPDLGRMLRRLGELGARGFYEEPVASAIVKTVNQAPVNPGKMALEDLAGYDAVLRSSVSLSYRGYTLYGMGPPSSGGVAIFETLALLEDRPGARSPLSASQLAHTFVEATRLAFADRDRYVADGDFVAVPLKGLLDPDYLRTRAQSLDWDAPLSPAAPGRPPGVSPTANWGNAEDTEYVSTSHFTVVDAQRNAVAMTASVEQAFGSGMVVPGWGFLLNNELTDFDAQPKDDAGRWVANRPERGKRPRMTALEQPERLGGKRPRSSMAPTLAFKDGSLALTLGSPGGSRIIPYVALTLERVVREGMPLQRSIDAPLLAHARGTTVLEPEWTPDVGPALEKLGHRVETGRLGSGLHGIQLAPDGMLHSGVDPRREGAAEGY